MISPETFYKQTHDNFGKVFDKMDDLHKETQDEIKELTKTITDVNGKIDTHIAVKKAIEDKESNDKKRNIAITSIIVVVGLGLFKALESLFA